MNKITKAIISLGIMGVIIPSYFGISKANRNAEMRFEESNRPIIGTVIDESYQNTLSPVPNWNGLVSYSNETVKLESKYTLKVKTDDERILGVSVLDAPKVKKEAIDAIVNKGTRISFPSGNLRHGNWFVGSLNKEYLNESNFTPKTQVGNKSADRIKILR